MIAFIKRLFFLWILMLVPALPVFLLVWALAISQPAVVTVLVCAGILLLTSLVAEHIVRFSNASSEIPYNELSVIKKRLWAINVRLNAKVLVTAGKHGKVEYFKSFLSDGLIVIDQSVLNRMSFDERFDFFRNVVAELNTGKIYLRTIAVIWKKIAVRSFRKKDVEFFFGGVEIKRISAFSFLRLLLSYPWIYLIDRSYFAFDNRITG